MSASMITALQGLVTPGLIKTVSATLGESESAVTSGLEGIVSKILAALTGGTSNLALMNTVAGLVAGQAKDPNALGDITGLLTGNSLASVAAISGSQLAGALFGVREAGVAQAAAAAAGLKPRSAGALMSLAAPLVLGALGKAPGAASMTGSALPALLSGAWPSVASVVSSATQTASTAAPAASTAAAAALPAAAAAAVAAKAATPAATASPPPSASTAPVAVKTATAPMATSSAAVAAKDVKHAAAAATSSKEAHSSGAGWWLWPVTLALIGGLAWAVWNMQVKSHDSLPPAKADVEKKAEAPKVEAPKVEAKVEKKVEVAAVAPAPAPKAEAPAVTPVATAGADGMMKMALPSGPEISYAAGGVESELINFLVDPAKVVDKNIWFNFDRLHFETGSTNLKEESKAQVANVVEIMKAFPASVLKIGGYTDNVGDPANNKKLSDDRAKAVAASIVAGGIDAKRVEAEGYGEEHAVADNSTDEGRAKNRRTAMSVRGK